MDFADDEAAFQRERTKERVSADAEAALGRRYERSGEAEHSLDPEVVRAWRLYLCELGVIDCGRVDGYFLRDELKLERISHPDAPRTMEYIAERSRQRLDENANVTLQDIIKEFERFEYEVEQQEQFEAAHGYLRWIGIRPEQLDMVAMSQDAEMRNSIRRLARIMRDGSMALLVERLREEAQVKPHDYFDVFDRAIIMMRENNLVGEMVDQGEHEAMLKMRRGAVAAAVRRLIFEKTD